MKKQSFFRAAALAVLAVLLLSAVCLSIVEDHECCGDGCRICAVIVLLQSSASGRGQIPLALFGILLLQLLSVYAARSGREAFPASSPVALRDVMNN